MNETNETLRLLNILDDRLARWYQSDNTDHGTLMFLEILRENVNAIRRAVWKMEEAARESN